MITFEIEDDFIKLDQLLKACRIAYSGGEAHQMVDNGMVMLNGQVETRRRAKIKSGDTIQVENIIVQIIQKQSNP